jgi:outer membrane immunogenic protein
MGVGAPDFSGFTCAGIGTTCFSGSKSSFATGWTAGAGFEYAVSKNISLKAEYMYVSLGTSALTERALALGGGPATTLSTFNVSGRTTFNIARLGVNYHF